MLPGCLPLLVVGALQALDARPDTIPVPRAAIADAMREEQGYERREPTNQTRLQTRVLLRLGRARPRPFGVRFRAVARDDLDAGMTVHSLKTLPL